MMNRAFALAAIGAMMAVGIAVPSADAKTRVTIGIGDGYYDGCRYYDAYGRCFGPDRYVDEPYYGQPDYLYDEPSPSYGRISCEEAVGLVRDQGFRRVRILSCGGKYHVLRGIRRGALFQIAVNRKSGTIRSIRRIR